MPWSPKDECHEINAKERGLKVGGEEWLGVGAILEDILDFYVWGVVGKTGEELQNSEKPHPLKQNR